MKTKGVLFDYNGVIVNDEHLQEQSLATVLKTFGVSLTHELYKQHCLGRTDAEAFANLQQASPDKLGSVTIQELIEQQVHEYLTLIRQQRIIFPDIREVFARLHPEYRLGVVTASLKAEVLPVLEGEKLLPFLEGVITADDVTKGKPDPEGYLKGVVALNIPKENIVVIEDSPSGVKAAKAAGLKCVAVLHTVSAKELAQADMVINTIKEVDATLLEKLLNSKVKEKKT
jgi:HAD superfamily hydrolase (TIGR01509 family)